jgi:fatty-acyl-CoA synthase
MRGLMQDRPLVVPVLLEGMRRQFADKEVISRTTSHRTVASFGEIETRVRRLATVLDDLDVPADARVGTFGWNSQRHLELYLGVPSTGRVLHTINHRLFAEQITYIVDDARDDVLFVDRTILATIWAILRPLTTVRWIVVMDDGDDPLPDDPRILDYDTLVSSAEPQLGPFDVTDERTAASLCYTSGTTGPPKGVLYDHRSIVLHAMMLLAADGFAIGEADVVAPIVPMFHVNAWGLPYAAVLTGACLSLPGPRTTPADLADQLAADGATFAAAVTTVWREMLPHVAGRHRLPQLRRIISGGGAVPLSLSAGYRDAIGLRLSNAWGMTETGPVVTSSRIGSSRSDLDDEASMALLASPGPSLPLTSMRLVSPDDGHEVAWDGTTPGELQVAGPTICRGYFGAEDGATSFTDDGWLRTGDIGTIDAQGYLRIVDRTKDLIKSGGEWISSVELENAIMAHPNVVEAAVIAVPDDKWSERPLACVVVRDGTALDPREVREHLVTRVAKWWIPEQIVLVDEIPKTATGKFSKLRLREQIGPAQLS